MRRKCCRQWTISGQKRLAPQATGAVPGNEALLVGGEEITVQSIIMLDLPEPDETFGADSLFVATFDWTNMGDEAASFAEIFYIQALQSGLGTPFIMNSEWVPDTQFETEVEPGGTLTGIRMVYILRDNSPVMLTVETYTEWQTEYMLLDPLALEHESVELDPVEVAGLMLHEKYELGETELVFRRIERVETYAAGVEALRIALDWTNLSDKMSYSDYMYGFDVTQKGEKLDGVPMSPVIDHDPSLRSLLPGATMCGVQYAYELIDPEAPVQFTIYPYSDESQSLSFELLPAEAPESDRELVWYGRMARDWESPQTLPLGEAVQLGSHDLIVNSIDYVREGEDEIVLRMGFSWTNGGDSAANSLFALDISAFQRGVGLKVAYGSEYLDWDAVGEDVEPGESQDVEICWYLINMNQILIRVQDFTEESEALYLEFGLDKIADSTPQD